MSCFLNASRRGKHQPTTIHRMRLVIIENDEIALVLVQLLDRLQQLVSGSLELAIFVHAARAIDHVYERLTIPADAEEFGGRFARRSLTRASAAVSLTTETARRAQLAGRCQATDRSALSRRR